MLVSFEGKLPQVAADAFVAPTAALIGDVVVEERASVWFGAVLRGDFGSVHVGAGSSVQDNSVVHASEELATRIGREVTVGHGSLLEGCTIEDNVVIGMGSIVLQGARVGRGSMLAAGSVVTEGQQIPAGVLAAGVPAKVKKEISGEAQAWVEHAAAKYQSLRLRYLGRRAAAVIEEGG